MLNDNEIIEFIVNADNLQPGLKRVTIILDEEKYKKLKQISDVKEVSVKDIVNGLIDIYIDEAITQEDMKNMEIKKEDLTKEIKELIQLQEDVK